jgi:hypothetical protein
MHAAAHGQAPLKKIVSEYGLLKLTIVTTVQLLSAMN